MSTLDPTIVVIAKAPVPGRVKTRLTPAVTPAQAARLASAALHDTLEVVASAPASRRVLALDGQPGDWLPCGFEVVPQAAGGLDRRLAHAFSQVVGPTVLVGMDTPQLTPADLAVDFDTHDAWLGPSLDGGYWLISMADPDPAVFPGVLMSTPRTGVAQLERLESAGFSVGLTAVRRDVDTIEDALVVATEAPHTRFAMEFDRITAAGAWASHDAYGRALSSGSELFLVDHHGARVRLQVPRWLSEPDDADESLLQRCTGATLDVGCGPGRFAIALSRRGIGCLGVDIAPAAVAMTEAGGARAVCTSVFAPLPGEGTWDTVLLADGNLGIAGDPDRLLRRAHQLLRPGGTLLLEPATVDVDRVDWVRIVDATGAPSHPFKWAHVGPQAARQRAIGAGFRPKESWARSGRSFLSFAR